MSGLLQVQNCLNDLSLGDQILIIIQIGCSSGFGRRLATSALARGDLVIATARTVENIRIPVSPNLRTLQLDLTSGSDAIKLKVDEAAAMWGRIDVLCNNAGDLNL